MDTSKIHNRLTDYKSAENRDTWTVGQQQILNDQQVFLEHYPLIKHINDHPLFEVIRLLTEIREQNDQLITLQQRNINK